MNPTKMKTIQLTGCKNGLGTFNSLFYICSFFCIHVFSLLLKAANDVIQYPFVTYSVNHTKFIIYCTGMKIIGGIDENGNYTGVFVKQILEDGLVDKTGNFSIFTNVYTVCTAVV